jgi:arabinose-5-phosphate isomerase
MTVNPLTLKPETLVSEALNLMNEKSITNIFVTQKNKPVGIIHMHEILRLST